MKAPVPSLEMTQATAEAANAEMADAPDGD